MYRRRRWRGRRRRGIAEIIGAILLIALTLVAGVLLWTFRIYTPPTPLHVSLVFRSGGSNPAWGDPTDCQPAGTWTYPLSGNEVTTWSTNWYNQCELFSEDEYATPGNFSTLNTTEIIFNQLSSLGVPTSEINFTFLCNGAYAPAPYTVDKTTVLLTGTLDTMTWFPGTEGQAPADSPDLGYCGNFDEGEEAGVAYGNLFTRLMIFEPLSDATTNLAVGDTMYLYIHLNNNTPLDYACVTTTQLNGGNEWLTDSSICPNGQINGPQADFDDYHGTPPWCFESLDACTIDITYTGSPSALLASIPVSELQHAS